MLADRRLAELLGAFRERKVAVVGDFSLDRYGEGEVSGTSRETGDRVNRLWRHSFNPGGAGNVAWNLAALSPQVRAITAIGDDWFGNVLAGCLKASGICTADVCLDPVRITGSYEKLKIRQHDGTVREVRVDVDNRLAPSAPCEDRLIAALRRAAEECDAIVAADYNEEAAGVLTERVTDAVREIARSGRAVYAASRTRLMDFAPAVLVGNEYEMCHASGVHRPAIFEVVERSVLEEVGGRIVEATGRACFITLGERGALAFSENGEVMHVPTVPADGTIDITGAGDSFLAALVLALSSGATPEEAALLGNLAANVTVRKLNTTGTASPDELVAAYELFSAAGRA